MKSRICVICQQEFIPQSPRAKTCSKKCRKEKMKRYGKNWSANNVERRREYDLKYMIKNRERKNRLDKARKHSVRGYRSYANDYTLEYYTPDHFKNGQFVGIPSAPDDPVCKFDITHQYTEKAERLINDILSGKRKYYG